MCSMVGFIDPAAVSANAGSLTDRSQLVAGRLQKTDSEQIFMMPYNSGPGRKAPIWKTLPGTPKQPSSVECGYYVMRFMRDIIMDPSLEFEKKGKEQAPYPQEAIDVVRNEWAEFVCLHME
ncbi:unnamed protein product [Prunus brigantina]